jgi:hypothetical protein
MRPELPNGVDVKPTRQPSHSIANSLFRKILSLSPFIARICLPVLESKMDKPSGINILREAIQKIKHAVIYIRAPLSRVQTRLSARRDHLLAASLRGVN